MAERPACERSAGHDQIMFSLSHFGKNLTQNESVSHPHFRRDPKPLKALFLREKVAAQLGAGLQESIDIFFEPDEIGIDGGGLRHDVQECNRRAHCRRDFAGQLDRRVDVIFPAGANDKTLQRFAGTRRE